MPLPKVIELRQILADKFPGLRLRFDANPPPPPAPPAALSPLLDLFQNQFAKGAWHELVAGKETSGSATFTRALMEWAAARNQIMALVDGLDSFDAATLAPAELARFFWVRCLDAETALKAADLLLRDGNLSIILLDLKLNPESQLRKIPATTWYRLQRLAETTGALCLAVTPRPLVAPAQLRLVLKTDFSLADLEEDAAGLLPKLKWEMENMRHLHTAFTAHSG
jgi:hypothetical protein